MWIRPNHTQRYVYVAAISLVLWLHHTVCEHEADLGAYNSGLRLLGYFIL